MLFYRDIKEVGREPSLCEPNSQSHKPLATRALTENHGAGMAHGRLINERADARVQTGEPTHLTVPTYRAHAFIATEVFLIKDVLSHCVIEIWKIET